MKYRKIRKKIYAPAHKVALFLLLSLCVFQLCGVSSLALGVDVGSIPQEIAPAEGNSQASGNGAAGGNTPAASDAPVADNATATGNAPTQQATFDRQLTVDTELLQEHGVYTVAYSENYVPFSYTDTNGNVAGMAISIMDCIAQLAGIEVQYVSVNDANRNGIDVDINLAILTEDQLDGVSNRSVSYTSLQMMAVSNTDTVDSQDATVGHLPYYYIEENEVERQLPGCTTYIYFSYSEMAQDFLTGNLDYMLVTSLVSSQMLETTYDVDNYVIPTSMNLNMYMSFSDEMDADTVASLNNLIRSLDSDYIYSLMLSTVIAASDAEMTTLEVLQAYAVPILVSILIVFAFFVAVIFRMTRIKRQSLEEIINVDGHTQLMTEHKFMEETQKILQTAKAGEYYLITIDIDNFKTINEVYGYDVGTRTIIRFGAVLQSIFPKSALVARFFADSFAVLYKADALGLKISEAAEYEAFMAQTMDDLFGQSYRITTSTGIYKVDDLSLPLSYMIDCANVARRQGKTSYGSTQILFTKDIEHSIHLKNDIVLSMETAMKQKEFQVYYQPKVSLKTGELIGAEALIRWIQADGQIRYPDQFIPLFESNGFIREIDFFVLETVCVFLSKYPEIPKIAVNFSGYSMLDGQLVQQVQSIIRSHGIEPGRLEIEITESAVVSNFEPMVEQTTRLKELKLAISMDDFGAGISSLNRLKDLDIDVLKIDKGFLREKDLGKRSVAIVQHIISMARELGIVTVAEGVEYGEQEALLKNLGCDMAQGYHYARPMPEADYLEFVHTYKPEWFDIHSKELENYD